MKNQLTKQNRVYEISAYEVSKGMTVDCSPPDVFNRFCEFWSLLDRGEFKTVDDLEADVFLRLKYPIEHFRVGYNKWLEKHNGVV